MRLQATALLLLACTAGNPVSEPSVQDAAPASDGPPPATGDAGGDAALPADTGPPAADGAAPPPADLGPVADARPDAAPDAPGPPGDRDDDGIPDADDVCPEHADHDQRDADADGAGDACDRCPSLPDPAQLDTDADGLGDACDACPDVPREGANHDDADGDGLPACAGDCDDADPARRPGREERCNGLDDDCDGRPDQTFPELGQPCEAGAGICRRAGEVVCDPDTGTTCSAAAGAPGAEICDTLDNDCDGRVDEELPACCVPGATEPCGLEVGACRPGTSRCGPDGAWGPCEGGVDPGEEVCNGADDDCDGLTDEALGQRTCGAGACERVLPVCREGAPVACDPLAGARDERCNDLDDDCDGAVDEDFPGLGEPCAEGVGRCRREGLGTCGPDGVTCSATAGLPADEVCNGDDDDCDGATDEGVPAQLCGVGACEHSVSGCNGGVVPFCDPRLGAEAERCDGLDNDCNGAVDDSDACCEPNAVRPCGTDEGLCVRGTQRCGAGSTWGECLGAVEPVAERCDGLDNDCDARVDDGLEGLGAPCGSGVGACRRQGVGVCGAGGAVVCSAQPGAPSPEICNAIDDDCDGLNDEEVCDVCAGTLYGNVCVTRLSASCQAGSAIAYCAGFPDSRVATHAEFLAIIDHGWVRPNSNYHTMSVDQVAACGNGPGAVEIPGFGDPNRVWNNQCADNLNYCSRAILCVQR